ncbi:hypothetical protein DSM104299_03183 [Baekduia alba]|uniref:helix-turn-helix domain-containing protein n=1 Tax=Baekduia alba TaxID=2997333 RepID=UPI002341EBCA|nr:helix-turn-helix transcriptional regulator [Baekduia alba]WCB94446.1 hypothetical protein DSM104299_03183 [Baekduia alba]
MGDGYIRAVAQRKLQVRAGIGPLLTRLRQEHDPPLTQRQAAELVGVDIRNWGNWERENAAPALASILRISETFGISTQDFIQPASTDDTTPATRAEIARLESKMDLLLDHFDILPAGAHMPDAPAEITDLEQPQPKRRRRS